MTKPSESNASHSSSLPALPPAERLLESRLTFKQFEQTDGMQLLHFLAPNDHFQFG